jgi:hypothetical protein
VVSSPTSGKHNTDCGVYYDDKAAESTYKFDFKLKKVDTYIRKGEIL